MPAPAGVLRADEAELLIGFKVNRLERLERLRRKNLDLFFLLFIIESGRFSLSFRTPPPLSFRTRSGGIYLIPLMDSGRSLVAALARDDNEERGKKKEERAKSKVKPAQQG